MWSNRVQRTGSDTTNPTTLTLRELMATQPRHVRGRLLPGERYPTGMRPGRRRAQGMDLDSVGPYVPWGRHSLDGLARDGPHRTRPDEAVRG